MGKRLYDVRLLSGKMVSDAGHKSFSVFNNISPHYYALSSAARIPFRPEILGNVCSSVMVRLVFCCVLWSVWVKPLRPMVLKFSQERPQ